jgi:phosphoribosylpyrophosphate synthetase
LIAGPPRVFSRASSRGGILGSVAGPVRTDSVETQPTELSDKVEVVSVAPLFGEAIRRIARNESISVLFD